MVVDPPGAMLARTNDTPGNRFGARRAAASSPRIATAAADGLYLSEPLLGGPEGRAGVSSCRAGSSGPAAAFSGVLAAVIEIETFDRLYRTIDLGEGGFITLLSLDGTVITRVPDPHDARGREFLTRTSSPQACTRTAASTAGRSARSSTSACSCRPPRCAAFRCSSRAAPPSGRFSRPGATRHGCIAAAHAAHLGGRARPDRARRLGARAARARDGAQRKALPRHDRAQRGRDDPHAANAPAASLRQPHVRAPHGLHASTRCAAGSTRFIHPEHARDRGAAARRNLRNAGKVVTQEVRIRSKDG